MADNASPADQVAVQWDVAIEFGILEEAFVPGGAQALDAIIAALAVRAARRSPRPLPPRPF